MTNRSVFGKSDDDRRPVIGITVGETAGVGPELALQCADLPEVTRRCRPLLYGPKDVLCRVADAVGYQLPDQIVDVGQLAATAVEPGTFTIQSGRASFTAVECAIKDAMSGKIDGIVTGPIQKQAWNLAGVEFPGHTELFADRCGVTDYCMMLTSPQISCVLVTIHVPLTDVARLLSVEGVLRAIKLAAQAMEKRQARSTRVTVCGLNPHAGENGLFSHSEEERLIAPAIAQARQLGINVSDPLPPDTAITPAVRKNTDVYVCMYHDQGLIPLKALAFDDAVNVTLGLPIVRTSVDHGTALGLAWLGKANHRSMLAAIHMAIDLAHD
jgi:4-hydroxythreonine-4-phosphate dehydrogenase